MVFSLRFYALVLLTLCPALVLAQNSKSSSDVEMGSSTKSLLEVENKIQTGVPGFLDNIQDAQKLLKAGKWEESQAAIQQAQTELNQVADVIKSYSNFQEVDLGLKNIEMNLREANYALQRRRKVDANREIGEAYKTTKALADSPVLKLSAAKVSLGAANQEIINRNYANAGLLLQNAIDSLSALQDNPYINKQEINALKNDIVIAHQQVILGKMQNKNYMSQIYDRASAATSNSFYQYYDIWTRTNLPWDQY